MLYDTVYSLGYLFQVFLQDNPDLLEESPSSHCADDEHVASAEHPVIERRLLEWLARQSTVTDPVRRAILLQMVQEYTQLEGGQEVLQTLIAS